MFDGWRRDYKNLQVMNDFQCKNIQKFFINNLPIIKVESVKSAENLNILVFINNSFLFI